VLPFAFLPAPFVEVVARGCKLILHHAAPLDNPPVTQFGPTLGQLGMKHACGFDGTRLGQTDPPKARGGRLNERARGRPRSMVFD
jgi:hypothetical protein